MTDQLEVFRRRRLAEINAQPGTRQELEAAHGGDRIPEADGDAGAEQRLDGGRLGGGVDAPDVDRHFLLDGGRPTADGPLTTTQMRNLAATAGQELTFTLTATDLSLVDQNPTPGVPNSGLFTYTAAPRVFPTTTG